MTRQKKASKKAMLFMKKVTHKSGDTLGHITNVDSLIKQKVQHTAIQSRKTQGNTSKRVFQDQIPKLGNRIFGKKFHKPIKFAQRFIPDVMLHKAIDTSFYKVAELAEKWSLVDCVEGMPSVTADLTDFQKADISKLVANQNRAYAALGSGLTGTVGRVGTLTDLLWLLLLTLRLIYQTAHIHGEKLTGKQGAKRAFDILSQADLSMLAEKHAVIISMSAAGDMVDDIDLQVLEGLIKSDGDVAFFKEALSHLVSQLNVNISFSWLLKFLPIATGVTSAVYSVYIINEVSAILAAEYKQNVAMITTCISQSE